MTIVNPTQLAHGWTATVTPAPPPPKKLTRKELTAEVRALRSALAESNKRHHARAEELRRGIDSLGNRLDLLEALGLGDLVKAADRSGKTPSLRVAKKKRRSKKKGAA